MYRLQPQIQNTGNYIIQVKCYASARKLLKADFYPTALILLIDRKSRKTPSIKAYLACRSKTYGVSILSVTEVTLTLRQFTNLL